MSLPKNLSESLIKKLNSACSTFSAVCDRTCGNIGWCETCWISAGSDNGSHASKGIGAIEVTRGPLAPQGDG